ncbi:MAG: exopolysaccharide biosynthesis protein [Bosea sp. (in: a-proteobacteria)]
MPHSSELLTSLSGLPGERLYVRDVMRVLGDRAYALLVVLLGLPNCLPLPPPIPLMCGLMLAGVAAQLLIGRLQPWLPPFLLKQSVSMSMVANASRRVLPWLVRIERFCQPRMVIFQQYLALRLIGLVLLALALGLLVAAPIIGQIPIGLGVCLIGLALVERDGVLLMAGCIIGAIGLALTAGFAWALLSSAKYFLHALFS